MAPKYAKDQPSGFVNRIERVAIVGAGGTLGKYITEALIKTGNHTVTALTRADSTNKLPEGVTTVTVSYDDEQSLVDALRGQQVLIITMAIAAPPDTHSKLVRAAAEANVPYVMPNCWGNDTMNQKLQEDTLYGTRLIAARREIESLGVSKWITPVCGFWYEFSLGGSPDRYGFGFHDRTLVFFDDGETKINTSTWLQCGRGVASFLSLKLLPDDENDKEPAIDNWANNVFYISSFLVSQRDMFESVKRVTGTTDAEWKITYESSEERYKKAVQDLNDGNRRGFVRLLYTRVFYPNGGGDYETSKGIQNEILDLPKEDMDEATKEAIRLALSGELSYGDRRAGLGD
ncbi:Sterol-4-alpha-carboxylate 3-dehydrogenase, decarboxylating [Cytospora mali]|uniref:Sterol-4-alpha-carboxylate 3-dehydrogenase, decarboxylating n=1 Tax=Cytospora mali TaxID=578113 RepID=A0A194W1E0_CYTMA|nr:Sterol-4-alpha-carboxylate 3-dehydrogenase, decarboxylating [Valsa mali]